MRCTLFALCVCVALVAAELPAYCGIEPFAAPKAIPVVTFANATLIQVQTLFRHGDRTPAGATTCWYHDAAVWDCNLGLLEQSSFDREDSVIDAPSILFRKTPVQNEEFFAGNCLVGQLTMQGYRQHIQNGQTFAAAYVGEGKLLPSTLDMSMMYLRADDCPRTLQSTEAVFMGMYPDLPSGGATTPVISLHYADETTDFINPNGYLCPVLNTYNNDFPTSPVFAQFNATYLDPLTVNFSRAFQIPYDEVDLGNLFDCYYAHVCHNFSLPAAVSQETWDNLMSSGYEEQYLQMNYPTQNQYARASSGPFIQNLWKNWMGAMNGTQQPVFYAFGGHDSSVMPLLSAFKLMTRWTPYAGYALFELYQMDADPTDYAVRMIVYGEPTLVPGCSDVLCPWAEFSAVIENLLPTAGECYQS